MIFRQITILNSWVLLDYVIGVLFDIIYNAYLYNYLLWLIWYHFTNNITQYLSLFLYNRGPRPAAVQTRRGRMAYTCTLVILLGLSLVVCEVNSWLSVHYEGQNLTAIPERYFKNGADFSRKTISINAANNIIIQVPKWNFRNYNRLQSLRLDNNKLRYISPLAFSGTTLRTLNLSQNELSCIPDFSEIKNSLGMLYISRNRLSQCVNGQVYSRQFTRLLFISLNGNNLKHLAAMTILWAAPSLQYVEVEKNELKHIPNFLPLLPKLKSIRLAGNPLKCSCEIRWLKKIKTVGLTTRCQMFGALSGKLWESLTSLNLDNHCQAVTTFVSEAVETVNLCEFTV